MRGRLPQSIGRPDGMGKRRVRRPRSWPERGLPRPAPPRSKARRSCALHDHVERGDLDPVAALLLGEIQRLVRLRQELGHVERHFLAIGYADADGSAGRPSTFLAATANRSRMRLATLGDRLLEMFTESARKSVRATDLLGRLGDEEFAAMLYDTTRDKARTCRTARPRRRGSDAQSPNPTSRFAWIAVFCAQANSSSNPRVAST
jgi:hypothetical protein